MRLLGHQLCTEQSPTSALRGIIFAKTWYKRNDLIKLRVFGCKAWTTEVTKKDKLELLGYLLWLFGRNTFIIPKDVHFDGRKINFKENLNVNIHQEDEGSDDKKLEKKENEKNTNEDEMQKGVKEDQTHRD